MAKLTGTPPPGIGHNLGPSMEAGRSWRIHSWTRAKQQAVREKLTPDMARRRVARARELGLDYASYASIRATSGRDVSGFLFSSTGLRITPNRPDPSDEIVEKLSALKGVARIAMLHAPLDRIAVDRLRPFFDAVHAAPSLLAAFPRIRSALAKAQEGRPAAGLVVIGTGLEADWVAAGRLGGMVEADHYFAL